jgi:hypothetical protein
MLAALGICISASASIGIISHLLRNAPEAWEDEAGFHFGVQAHGTATKISRHRLSFPLRRANRRRPAVGSHVLN